MSSDGRGNRLYRRCLVFGFTIALGSYSIAVEKGLNGKHLPGIKKRAAPPELRVKNVLKDFTFELSNGEKARLIGIQRVPTKRRAESADEKTIQFLKNIVVGKAVSLTYDDDMILRGHKDNVGRLVAYVWVKQESSEDLPVYYVFDHVTLNSEDSRPDIFLNGTVIRAGYAVGQDDSSFRFQQEFKRYGKEAREAKRGLWKR
jgi:endonuclease YncB( thermonuclease family)